MNWVLFCFVSFYNTINNSFHIKAFHAQRQSLALKGGFALNQLSENVKPVLKNKVSSEG